MRIDLQRVRRREGIARLTTTFLIACVGLAAASDKAATSAPPPAIPQGPAPATVSVPGGDMTVGFAAGAQRQTVNVASFKVTKHPITVREYRACVESGACAAVDVAECGQAGGLLDRSTAQDPGAANVPVTCVSAEQAAAFCGWTGGRLPRATEWLRAARGESVQKYPWGAAQTTCARHPVAEGILADARSCCAQSGAEGCSVNTLAEVGAHPEGASVAGVEDVLLARGELALSDDRAALTRCGSDTSTCVVTGTAGAIEGVVAWQSPGAVSTTFRCAYEETR
jgi:formylglycine-generating enzyme required for sulfatase activity